MDTRRARKCLMYKVDALVGEEVIYATPERAAFHSQVKHALEDSTTWGEFRRAMPRKEYSRLLRVIFDDNDVARPHGSDTFSMDQIPGACDCDYPGWLQQEMLHGVLPEDVVEKYGKASYSFVSGPRLVIDSTDLDDVNAELEKQGYELIDGSGLYLEG